MHAPGWPFGGRELTCCGQVSDPGRTSTGSGQMKPENLETVVQLGAGEMVVRCDFNEPDKRDDQK